MTDSKALQNDIAVALGAKQMQSSPNDPEQQADLGLAQKKTYQKDEDGEYENTKGLDNQMLLQQQRNQLENQDVALGKISNVLDHISIENE